MGREVNNSSLVISLEFIAIPLKTCSANMLRGMDQRVK